MWWMTTTPPLVDGASGRATYASTSSPPAPVILLVPARMASSISVPPVVVARLIGPHRSVTGRSARTGSGRPLVPGNSRSARCVRHKHRGRRPGGLLPALPLENRGQALSGRAAAGGGRRRARQGDGRPPRQG